MHKHMGKFIQKFEFFIDFWIHPSHATCLPKEYLLPIKHNHLGHLDSFVCVCTPMIVNLDAYKLACVCLFVNLLSPKCLPNISKKFPFFRLLQLTYRTLIFVLFPLPIMNGWHHWARLFKNLTYGVICNIWIIHNYSNSLWHGRDCLNIWKSHQWMFTTSLGVFM
jgi:hypothetical protein